MANTIYGVINADQVNFRSGPGTNHKTYQQLNTGLVVTVKSAYEVSGSGCAAGWINIYYNNQILFNVKKAIKLIMIIYIIKYFISSPFYLHKATI